MFRVSERRDIGKIDWSFRRTLHLYEVVSGRNRYWLIAECDQKRSFAELRERSRARSVVQNVNVTMRRC